MQAKLIVVKFCQRGLASQTDGVSRRVGCPIPDLDFQSNRETIKSGVKRLKQNEIYSYAGA